MPGKVLIFWVGLAGIGIVNGTVRQYGYGPFMSAGAAHVVSCLTAIVLILFAVRWFVLRERSHLTQAKAAGIGAAWVALTILFEFGFGHWVIGHTWDRLLADYDVLAGRFWVLVLMVIGVAPWLWVLRFASRDAAPVARRRVREALHTR